MVGAPNVGSAINLTNGWLKECHLLSEAVFRKYWFLTRV